MNHASKEVLLTARGLADAKEKLEYLKVVRRQEVLDKIKHAKSFGDLSENSEYDEAKNEQAEIETQIAELENVVNKAKLIDENSVQTDVVSVGTKVVVKNIDRKVEVEYYIVGSSEVDPANNRISYESPVGKGLLGHKPNETVTINVPAGTLRFKILSISK